MNMQTIYAFAGGAAVGRFIGIIPSLMGIGIMLFVVNPELYSSANLNQGHQVIRELIKNLIK